MRSLSHTKTRRRYRQIRRATDADYEIDSTDPNTIQHVDSDIATSQLLLQSVLCRIGLNYRFNAESIHKIANFTIFTAHNRKTLIWRSKIWWNIPVIRRSWHALDWIDMDIRKHTIFSLMKVLPIVQNYIPFFISFIVALHQILPSYLIKATHMHNNFNSNCAYYYLFLFLSFSP